MKKIGLLPQRRALRFETMEERALLSVTVAEFEAIRTVYSDFDLPEESSRIQITDLVAPTADSLRAAVASATESTADDLILIRTTSSNSTVWLGEDPLALRLSNDSGRLALIVWGESSLTLIGRSSVIKVVSGEIALGGITLTGLVSEEDGNTGTPSDLLVVDGNARILTSRLLFVMKKDSETTASVPTSEAALPRTTFADALDDDAAGAPHFAMEFNLAGTERVYMTGLTASEVAEYQTTIYALSEEYYIGQYYDVNKYWNGDSQLCWAAATANILYYTGWADSSVGFSSAESVYDYMKENFTNVGGHLYYVLPWFLTGEYDVKGISGWAQPTDGSGAFYPSVSVNEIRTYSHSDNCAETILGTVVDYLKNDYGVAVAIGWYKTTSPTGRSGGHTISMWGYVYDTALDPSDPNYYTGLIVTDSDDRRSAKVSLSLEWNATYKQYRFSNYSSGSGWLEDFTCVKPKETTETSVPPEMTMRVTDQTVIASWSSLSSAAGYQLRYRVVGETLWQNSVILDKSVTQYVWNNLQPSTSYEFQIMATGSEASSHSDWSESDQIQTPSLTRVSIETDMVDETDGEISLREAIAYAEMGREGTTITFDSSLAGKTLALNATLGELVVTIPLTIDASALYDSTSQTPGILIDAHGTSRVFSIFGGTESSPVQLIGLSITGGKTSGSGGGLFVLGFLNVTQCRIFENMADYGGGIGLDVTGTTSTDSVVLRVTKSQIYNNMVHYAGGGIYQSGGTEILSCPPSAFSVPSPGSLCEREVFLVARQENSSGTGINGMVVVENSEIRCNTARSVSANSFGGGIALTDGGASLWMSNSLIVNNVADNGAGIYLAEGEGGFSRITNSTVAGNQASHLGGGLYAASAVTLFNSIIAINVAGEAGRDVYVDSIQPLSSSGREDSSFMKGTEGGDGESEATATYHLGMVSASYTLSSYSDWANAEEEKTNQLYNASRPLFIDADDGDFHLSPYSQAVNKGSSDDLRAWNGALIETDLDGKRRTIGSVTDLGAYEFEEFLADIDLDGFVGPGDRMFFSSAWFSSPSSEHWDARCDLDGDGFIGPGDYAIFSQAYGRF